MSNVVNVSLGNYYSAAITADGGLYTWGDNSYGRLGDGTYTDRYTPTKVVINKMAIDNFTLKDTTFESAKEYDPVYLNGKLSITFDKNDKERAEECVQNELNSILWSSSDPDVTEVTFKGCQAHYGR